MGCKGEVWCVGSRVECLVWTGLGLGFRVYSSGLGVEGLKFGVEGSGFRVMSSGFRLEDRIHIYIYIYIYVCTYTYICKFKKTKA